MAEFYYKLVKFQKIGIDAVPLKWRSSVESMISAATGDAPGDSEA